MKKSNHTCPVCGFSGLNEAPFGLNNEPSYEICPCCGGEFGNDITNDPKSLAQLRKQWLAKNNRQA